MVHKNMLAQKSSSIVTHDESVQMKGQPKT